MGYNFITNIESCYIQLPSLLYYSHWPSIIISLFFGFFVFFKSGRSLLGKILLAIAVVFSIWGLFSLITWTGFDSRIISFAWSFFETLAVLFFFLVLYFVYVFIEKRDVSFRIKISFLVLFLPVIAISSTNKYLTGFDITSCEAIENNKFLFYVYVLKAVAFIGTLALLFFEYFVNLKDDKSERSKIVLIGTGSLLLLLSFLTTQYFANLIFDNYKIEFYGLFAIDIFIAFLAYLIVKFKAFNIKLIGAQALVVALVLLVGSQFFFIQTTTNLILTGITLVLVGGVGIVLIRSVKEEVRRKEELQTMSGKLAGANDQLRKLDNAKSEFISIASHQLRTPLTAVKGFISLLLEGAYGKFDAKQNEVLNKVYVSNERLISLVEDLLNISRIESGRMDFRFDSCQLTKVCQELVDTFALRAKSAGLYLDYKVPEDSMPEVFVDGNKVREVISNMIDNAIKYTPKGGVTVRLEKVLPNLSEIQKIGGKGFVRVIIADTGIGIPADEIPYLFSKFSRGKDTSRLNTGGTGLGLYVGKSMIEANGGRIWAESEGAGQGSRFIIEVPIEQTVENLSKWS